MCILYNQRGATYKMFFIIISALLFFGRFFRPSSGVYKTVCAPLGIVMLSYCLPLVCLVWNKHGCQNSKFHKLHSPTFTSILFTHFRTNAFHVSSHKFRVSSKQTPSHVVIHSNKEKRTKNPL
jgi:hypothetical protein